MRRLAASLFLALAASLAAEAPAQDGSPPTIEIEVRTDRTLTDPGTPIADARAAFAAPGEGPDELGPTAGRADAAGLVRLPFPREGGTFLVWAEGFAPAAVHADGPRPRTVVLERGVPFTVQVFAPGGGPAARASVSVAGEVPVVAATDGAPDRHPLAFRAAADAQGRAVLTGLPAAAFTVTASAPGLVDVVRFPVDPRSGSLVVLLGRGARIGGTLRLLPGLVPAAGAVAILEGPRPGDRRVATLDAGGRFVAEGVVPGSWEIRFEGRGLVPPDPRRILVAEGRDRDDLAFDAWRTATLAGRLLDEDERPLAAARLEIAWPPSAGREPATHELRCDAEGRFRVDDVAPGDGIGLRVTAEGRVAASVEGVSLPPGGVSREVEVVLPRGAGLAGVLVDLEGRPIADAVVEALPRTEEDAGAAFADAVTGADGSFRLDGLPETEIVLRVALLGAPRPARFGPWAVTRGTLRDVGELRTFGGFDLAGRVDGAPEDVRVVATRDGREIASAPVVAGVFTLRGLPAGDVEVHAVRDDETGASAPASLPSAWPVTLVWRSPPELRARLVDEGGGVVAVATVDLVPVGAEGAADPLTIDVRDAEGRVSARVAAGRWRIEATDARGSSGALEVTVGRDGPAEPATVVLSPGVAVRGRVVDARSGDPLEAAIVRAVPVGGGPAGPGDLVDELGNFVLRGVPPGIWTIEVRAPEHPVHRSAPFVARLADGPDLGRIEVDPGVRVEGEVRGPSGAPGASLTVEVVTDQGTERAVATDRFGRYVVPGVEPGLAVLTVVSAEGRVLREARVLVPDLPDAWRHDVDLGAGGSVMGRVSAFGRDEPFARVAFRTGTTSVVRVETVCDAHGAFVVEGLPRGEAEVEVRPADAVHPWTTRVLVDGAAGQVVDLRLPEGSVEGVVRAADGGAAVPRAVVELRAEGDPSPVAESRTDDDGRYTLRHVPPGTYDVVATREGFGAAHLPGVVVTARGDPALADLDLPPHAAILLRLLDERRRPVTDGWAEARSAAGPDPAADGVRRVRSRADAAGRVVVGGLSRGAWRLTAGGGALASVDLGTVRVDEGPNDLGETVLPAAGGLDVVAFLGPLGPASGVVVLVRDVLGRDPRPERGPDDAFGRPDPRYATDAAGRLRIPGLAPGAWRVWAEGHEEAAVRVFVLAEAIHRVWLPVAGGRPSLLHEK